MEVKDFALNALNDVQAALTAALEGLTDDEVLWQPKPGANHIAYNLWHMMRVEDWFYQYLFQRVPQAWEAEKWHEKLNLPDDPRVTGYGYTAEQVDGFPRVKLGDLMGYAEAVRARTVDYLNSVNPARFDEIVKSRIFGEVKVGNMIGHLLMEIAQHVGQIAYIRGLMKGPGQ